MTFRKNKKGSLLDGIFISFIFIGFVLGGMLSLTILNGIFDNDQFVDDLRATGAGNATIKAQENFNQGGAMDNIIVLAYFLIHITVLVLAAFLPTNMIFLVMVVFFSMVNLLIAWIASQMAPVLGAGFGLANMSRTMWIANNMFLLEIVWISLTIVMMFVLGRVQQQ